VEIEMNDLRKAALAQHAEPVDEPKEKK